MSTPPGYDEKDEIIRSILIGVCLVVMFVCFLIVADILR
jgi:hypothetical protein